MKQVHAQLAFAQGIQRERHDARLPLVQHQAVPRRADSERLSEILHLRRKLRGSQRSERRATLRCPDRVGSNIGRRIRPEYFHLRQFGPPRLRSLRRCRSLDHNPNVIRNHRRKVHRICKVPGIELGPLHVKQRMERRAMILNLARELNRHQFHAGGMQHHLIDAPRASKMHPHPLRQMLKNVALPMARPQRVGRILAAIYRARNLFICFFAAE